MLRDSYCSSQPLHSKARVQREGGREEGYSVQKNNALSGDLS